MDIDFVPKSFSKRLSRTTFTSVAAPVAETLEESPTIHSKPDLACFYCGESDILGLVKCSKCNECFCNSGIRDSSHIYVHSKMFGHVGFELVRHVEENGEDVEKVEKNGEEEAKENGEKVKDLEEEDSNHAIEKGIIEYRSDSYGEKVENGDSIGYSSDNITAFSSLNVEDELSKIREDSSTGAADNSFEIIEPNEQSQHLQSHKTPQKFLKIKCSSCTNDCIFDLSFCVINKMSNTPESYFGDSPVPLDSYFSVIFVCSDNSHCLKSLQSLYTARLEPKPVFKNFKAQTPFGFKKFFADSSLLKDNSVSSGLLRRGFTLVDIYAKELSRVKSLEKSALLGSDMYGLLERVNWDEFPGPEHCDKLVVKKSELKNLALEYLSKAPVYNDLRTYFNRKLDLIYQEQKALYSLSSTSFSLTNNMVFISYKKITFTEPLKVVIRLNTNYHMPLLEKGQIVALRHFQSSRTAYCEVEQAPTNSFNPDIHLKVLTYVSGPLEVQFVGTKEFTLDPVITDYKMFNILPLDKVFSRVVKVMFDILSGKLKLLNYIEKLILGLNFENFEFDLSSMRSQPSSSGGNLNISQKRAVDNVDSNKVVVVKGSVGTGKTTVAANIIKKLVDKQLTPVLVCSGNSVSIDHLCEEFCKQFVSGKDDGIFASRLISRFKENSYNINHPIGHKCFHNFILSNAPEQLIDLYIQTKVGGLSNLNENNAERLQRFFFDFFSSQDVVFTTCYNSFDERLDGVQFKSVVIDDCQTSLESLTLLPLARNCERIVLIGDDKLAFPYIHDQTIKPSTLFDRIIQNRLVQPISLVEQYRMNPKLAEFPSKYFYGGQLVNGNFDSKRKSEWNRAKLNSSTASKRSVSGMTRSDSTKSLKNKANKTMSRSVSMSGLSDLKPRTRRLNWPNRKLPILFWDQSENKQYREEDFTYMKRINTIENFFVQSRSIVNGVDASRVVSIVLMLHHEHGIELKDIGVATLFAGQTALLAETLQKAFSLVNKAKGRGVSSMSLMSKLSSKEDNFLFENHNPLEEEMTMVTKVKGLEIGGLDSFEGREKDYMVISTVKSDKFWTNTLDSPVAEDWRRLNMMMTRAREGMFIVGSCKALSSRRWWQNYLAYLYESGCVVDGGEGTWKGVFREGLASLEGWGGC